MPKKPSLKIRKLITERAFGCYEYCMSQQKYSHGFFSIEHIIARSKNGNDKPENLALACQSCNNFKSTKSQALDPKTQKLVPLFNPRTENWKGHFKWNDRFTAILGLTPTGRATVRVLKLNCEFLINQRLVYIAYGIHPPKHTL